MKIKCVREIHDFAGSMFDLIVLDCIGSALRSQCFV